MSFLSLLWDVIWGAGISLFGSGEGEADRPEETVDEDDDGNHEALLFNAELTAAHDFLLDVVSSADLVVVLIVAVEAADDQVILLVFRFDVDDEDEQNSLS